MSERELAGVKVGDVIVCVSIVGEICGRLKEIKESSVVLESGRLFIPGRDSSSGGFSPSVGMIVKPLMDVVEVQLGGVVSVCPCHPEIEAAWIEYTTGIIV